jgi:hypothetical protein
MEREALTSVRARSCSTVSELFKDITDPTLLFVPVMAGKEEFLVVVKVFDPSATPKFAFADCLTIKKEGRRSDLAAKLTLLYP